MQAPGSPSQLFDLDGKVAIVTGGGKGIGRHLSVALAAAGATVVVASRTESDIQMVADEIRGNGHSAVAIPVDVTRRSSIGTLVESTVREFGTIDILINCAGRVALRSAFELTETDWEEMLQTNLTGLFFFCCQAAARVMARQRQGKIINIASALGLVGLEQRAAYCASKGAVIQLTRALAVEWAPVNITVNAIAPTTTLTGETAALYADPDALVEKTKDIPLRRLGRPEDLIGAALYLASAASEFVTGQTIVVDGGYTAR